MNRYEILCTPEQAKKALELGAPILRRFVDRGEKVFYINPDIEFPYPYIIPTAEEMCGWLETNGIYISVIRLSFNLFIKYKYSIWDNLQEVCSVGLFSCSKEATLEAIDAALEYLSKYKDESSC